MDIMNIILMVLIKKQLSSIFIKKYKIYINNKNE